MKCIHGHDIGVLGRYKSGHCARCMRIRAAKKRQATDTPDPVMRYLPAAPLREAMRLALGNYTEYPTLNVETGIHDLAQRYADRFGGKRNTAERSIYRIMHMSGTVYEDTADRWCSVLGLHLDLLWDPDEARDRKASA